MLTPRLGLLRRSGPTVCRRATPSVVRFSTSSISRAEAAPAAALSPKLAAIVDDISKLTLLEAADLVDALKVR